MITITIGSEERRFDAADEHWVTQQVNSRRADGVSPCVRITIRQGDLNLSLATAGCAARGGSNPGRWTPQETAIIELWRKRGLSDPVFSAGNLVAFLNQLKRSL